MDIEQIIGEVQSALGVPVDGKAGPMTWAAIYAKLITRIVPKSTYMPASSEPVDTRSEGHIATLHTRVQPYARALVRKAAAQGLTIKVLSGTRTYEEQDQLFAQGGVTKARAGYSNHNFGIAFDIGLFNGAKYVPESPLYKVIGALGVELGLDWGGNWKSFVDEPHFQLRPEWAKGMSESAMLAVLRTRKQKGLDAFA